MLQALWSCLIPDFVAFIKDNKIENILDGDHFKNFESTSEIINFFSGENFYEILKKFSLS